MSRWAVDFTPPYMSTIQLRDPANGLLLLGDLDGVDMPPVELSEQELFDQQGSQLNTVRFGPREVMIPLAIAADDAQTLRARCRALVSQMNPRLGDGTLTIRADDGSDSGRILYCRYAKGLDGTMETADLGDGWWAAVPVFRGFDPYWHDAAEQVYDFTTGGGGGGGAVNFFPMFADPNDVGPHFGNQGASVGTPDAQDIDNNGDDIVFPHWTITGPITNLVLQNLTTGQTMDFSNNGGLDLAEGDVMTIDPVNFPSIYDQSGRNLIPFLQPSSVPWALGIGVNRINVTGTAVGSASVRLAFRQRYLSA